MPDHKATISTLLEELNKTVKVRGIEHTIALLTNSRQEVSPDQHIQFVVVAVCNQFSLSIEQILTEKSDATKYAKGFIVFYLRMEFQTKWTEIGSALKLKNKNWLWQLMRLIKGLKPTLSNDRAYSEIQAKLDIQIHEYKTNNKSDHGK